MEEKAEVRPVVLTKYIQCHKKPKWGIWEEDKATAKCLSIPLCECAAAVEGVGEIKKTKMVTISLFSTIKYYLYPFIPNFFKSTWKAV